MRYLWQAFITFTECLSRSSQFTNPTTQASLKPPQTTTAKYFSGSQAAACGSSKINPTQPNTPLRNSLTPPRLHSETKLSPNTLPFASLHNLHLMLTPKLTIRPLHYTWENPKLTQTKTSEWHTSQAARVCAQRSTRPTQSNPYILTQILHLTLSHHIHSHHKIGVLRSHLRQIPLTRTPPPKVAPTKQFTFREPWQPGLHQKLVPEVIILPSSHNPLDKRGSVSSWLVAEA